MMIGFVSLFGFCLLLTGLSVLKAKQTRYVTTWSSVMICLGFIGGLLYVGVVEKVSWKFTGAYLGGTTVMLVTVLILGCLPPKTQNVINDDVDLYWGELEHRERKSQLQREVGDKNTKYSEL